MISKKTRYGKGMAVLLLAAGVVLGGAQRASADAFTVPFPVTFTTGGTVPVTVDILPVTLSSGDYTLLAGLSSGISAVPNDGSGPPSSGNNPLDISNQDVFLYEVFVHNAPNGEVTSIGVGVPWARSVGLGFFEEDTSPFSGAIDPIPDDTPEWFFFIGSGANAGGVTLKPGESTGRLFSTYDPNATNCVPADTCSLSDALDIVQFMINDGSGDYTATLPLVEAVPE